MRKRVVCAILSLALVCNAPAAEAGSESSWFGDIFSQVIGILAAVIFVNAIREVLRCKVAPVLDGIDGLPGGCVASPVAQAPAMQKTNKNAVALRKNLNMERGAAGMPPDPDDCEAHHIVPAEDNRKGVGEYTSAARSALKGCVEINSAENGIFLPNKEGGEGCEGPHNHRAIHRKDYYEPMAKRLGYAKARNGCGGVRSELGVIKNILRGGGMP